jgi:hypothetical protein
MTTTTTTTAAGNNIPFVLFVISLVPASVCVAALLLFHRNRASWKLVVLFLVAYVMIALITNVIESAWYSGLDGTGRALTARIPRLVTALSNAFDPMTYVREAWGRSKAEDVDIRRTSASNTINTQKPSEDTSIDSTGVAAGTTATVTDSYPTRTQQNNNVRRGGGGRNIV